MSTKAVNVDAATQALGKVLSDMRAGSLSAGVHAQRQPIERRSKRGVAKRFR